VRIAVQAVAPQAAKMSQLMMLIVGACAVGSVPAMMAMMAAVRRPLMLRLSRWRRGDVL
jgi:hypothetical protein